MKLEFNQYVDMLNINDSMELDSNTEICNLTTDDCFVTIEVRGEVDVTYKGNRYSSACEFPEDLKQIICDGNLFEYNGKLDEDGEVLLYIDMNNWYEAFYGPSSNNQPYYVTVEIDNATPSELLNTCLECVGFFRGENN